MPASFALLLLAILPLGQTAGPAGPSQRNTSPLDRRILAAESDPPGGNLPAGDACLRDVCFVAPRHGWAVGDRGLILHTDDGGQRWSPQSSGVGCTLNSVCFVDARIGWAAGGMAYPFLHDTFGVVLCTRDGGLTWQREPVLLPELWKVRFVSERQGWAFACSSAMYPGGMFLTRDGGRSWQPAASGGAAGLTTADLYDGRNAILAGSLGRTAVISDGEFARKVRPGAVLQDIHALQIVPPSYGWLLGDGGWIAITGDRGNSWRPPLGKLPACAAIFDFSAIAVRGGKCWIAGSPGSRIFSTSDAGRSWSAAPTGITVPLRAIAFADDLHGWAVGQLGTILATSDGGRTWQRQRAGGDRAALMAVAGRPGDLPLELIARACNDQGYLGVAEVLGRGDVEPGADGDSPLADRLHQAMLHAGACGGEMAWGFPVRPAALQLPAQAIVESWNRYHDGHAADALVGHLVRQIRTWRPDVLVVSAGRSEDGLRDIVRQSVDAAVKLAGDPAYAAGQLQAAGCEPWNVQRVYLASDSAASGDSAMPVEDWSPRLGQSWADAALPARGLLEAGVSGPAAIGVERIDRPSASRPAQGGPHPPTNDPPRPVEKADVMSGIRPTAGSNARRPTAATVRSQDSTLDGRAQQRQVAKLFADLEQEPEQFLARLAKGEELPQGIDATEAAVLTFRIAERLGHSGRWDLAEKVFALFIERFPDDPLARWAAVWRLQFLAGSESASMEVSPSTSSRAEQAISFARQIEMVRPELFALPSVRYPLAAAYRRLNQDAQAQRLYVLDHRGVDRDAWWTCARGERWLLERKGPPPKPLATCAAAGERPHLDGRLDKALWKKCKPIVLASPADDDRAWPGSVLAAHDEQFLYLAVQCRQAPGARYESTSERRTRDPDLSRHDRVDIYLDIGRSYASYYHLTIDHRGWAADACGDDPSWNPKWFVAAQTADGVWTAEAAIPLAELKTAIVPGKTVWAIGVQRTVPGVGFQSWTTPAVPAVMPEGFGWLEFE